MPNPITLEGHKQLRKTLKKLSGPQLHRVASKASRAAMRPMLKTAKRLTPVRTGRLRSSLGLQTFSDKRSGSYTVAIAPRRAFRYTARGGIKRVSGSGKKRRKAMAKGYAADQTKVQLYARGIEYGRDTSGRIRRRHGGVHFLGKAFTTHRQGALTTLAAALRQHSTSVR